LLRTYERAWLRPDLVPGLTLAAYLLPAGIGDASLAGLPPQAGIYLTSRLRRAWTCRPLRLLVDWQMS
jgi:MFS superfamily sulfate permease-like transporter